MTANEMRYNFVVLYDKIVNLAAPGYEDGEFSVLLTNAENVFINTHYNPLGNKYKEGFENSEKRRKDLSYLTRNINQLSIVGTATSQTGVLPYGRFWKLPDDYLWTIEEHCAINYDLDTCSFVQPTWNNYNMVTNVVDTLSISLNTGAIEVSREEHVSVPSFAVKNYKIVPVKMITHSQYMANVRNPFKNPTYEDEGLVWRLDYSKSMTQNTTIINRHELITNKDFMVVSYNRRYISKPEPIIVDTINPGNQVSCKLDDYVHQEIVNIAVREASGITDPNTYQLKEVEVQKAE